MSALDGVNLQLVLTLDEAMEFKRWLGTRRANNAIAVDTETTGLDPRDPGAAIRLIQFGDTTHGWAIPWQDWRGLALEALNAWDGDWVYHNVAFERRWLECHSPYRVDFSRSWDTMIAAHILDPLASGALKTLSRIHVDPRAAAGQRRLDDGMTQNGWSWATVPVTYPHYWTYGSLDATLTALLWDKFRGDLEGAGKYANVMTLEMAVLDVIGKMEQRGVSVDVEYSEREYARLIERSDIIKTWGKETHGVALGSPQQVAALLASKGISFANFTATGKPQVDKDLLKLLSNPDAGHSQEIQDIARGTLLLRESTKIANTYFRTFIESNIDNIVRPTIKTLGARTARMSVSGIPFQQLPKKDGLVRGAVVPRSEDNVILSADYSQIEMRVLAQFSEDQALQQAFITADDTGGDFFVEVGKDVYQEPGFVKSDKRRTLIKNVCYGLAYGAGVTKMAQSAGVPESQMRPVADGLISKYPGIKRFMRGAESEGAMRERMEGQGYVLTPLGRRLPCDEGKSYTLTNYKIQSTAADILKQALVRLDSSEYGEYMILPVHDEVVFDLPRNMVDRGLIEIPEIMQDLTYAVPLLAEAEGGFERWGDKYAD